MLAADPYVRWSISIPKDVRLSLEIVIRETPLVSITPKNLSSAVVPVFVASAILAIIVPNELPVDPNASNVVVMFDGNPSVHTRPTCVGSVAPAKIAAKSNVSVGVPFPTN